MTEVQPFCGVRYNQKKVKNIRKVFAPPYDIISAQEQKELYAQHPANIVRLILGKISKSDTVSNNRYTRAARFFQQWLSQGILVQEDRPCLYLYAQEYLVDGIRKQRFGFIGRMQFAAKGKGCLPHEHTLAKPKEDRLRLFREVRANLSPIFSFYLDKNNGVEKILKPFCAAKPLFDFKDNEQVRHRFWKVDDAKTINKVRGLMKKKQVFIADGHHRYEVSRMFHEEMKAAGRAQEAHTDGVMMYFTGFSADNLCVLPTHRVVKGVSGLAQKVAALPDYFTVTKVSTLKELSARQKKASGFSLGMFYKSTFYLLLMKNRVLLDRLMRKSPAQWRSLDVAMLNTIVFEHIFALNAAEKEEKIQYTRDAQEAVKWVKAKKFDIAFFPNATKPEQVKNIALSGSRMPQKSTYFYPKPISGLVINKF
jgi:Uncharacterized conserved protein